MTAIVPKNYDIANHSAALMRTPEARAALGDLIREGATIQPDEFHVALGAALKAITAAHLAEALREYENGIAADAIAAAVAALRVPKAG